MTAQQSRRVMASKRKENKAKAFQAEGLETEREQPRMAGMCLRRGQRLRQGGRECSEGWVYPEDKREVGG